MLEESSAAEKLEVRGEKLRAMYCVRCVVNRSEAAV